MIRFQEYARKSGAASSTTAPGATIAVYATGTSNLSTIYEDNGVTPKANPFVADSSSGYFMFYAANGRYDVRISGTGISQAYTWADITLLDSVDPASSDGRYGSLKIARVYDAKAYGAAGDGVTNDRTSLNTLANTTMSAGGTLHFPPGTYLISTSMTFPAGVYLYFEKGAMLKTVSGQPVTINSPMNDLLAQRFSGDGTVSFASNLSLKEVYPQWWGAVADGETDDTAAIQAAFTAAASGGTIRFPLGTYKTLSAITISGSNLWIEGQKATLLATRAGDPGAGSRYFFNITGTVNQTNVTFRGFTFTGSGFWGGIFSSALYMNEGWALSGYPNVDEDNYTTTRTKFRIENCTFTAPYYEAIFLTNTQCDVVGVRVADCANTSNVGAVVVRYTQNISLDRITCTNCTDKSINTSFVDGVTYSNIHVKDLPTADSLGFYFGYFNRNSHMLNCSVDTATGDPLKVSYWANRTTISDCTFNSDGEVMFQGAQYLTMSNCTVQTTGPRALQTIEHTGFSQPIDNNKVDIDGCLFVSTEDGSVEPKVVDLSYAGDTSFTNNTVRGNIYAYPGRDLLIAGNDIYYSSAYATPKMALYIRGQTGTHGTRIRNNRVVNMEDTNTIYLHGGSAAANFEVVGNVISDNSTASYATVVNYVTEGRFFYAGNIIFGTHSVGEIYENYTDDSAVTVLTTPYNTTLQLVGTTSATNLGLGTSTFGTNAAKVLALASGTAPTTSPADAAQLWVADVNAEAGKAGLHMRGEETGTQIIPGVVIKTDTGDLAYAHEGLICINTFDDTLKMYADGAWREIATSWTP